MVIASGTATRNSMPSFLHTVQSLMNPNLLIVLSSDSKFRAFCWKPPDACVFKDAMYLTLHVKSSIKFGHGKEKAAKTAVEVAILLAVGIGLLDSTLINSLRFEFSSLFSSDILVAAKAAKYIPLGVAMHLLDAIATVLGGILRAQGSQRIVFFVNLASYSITGVPMGLFLCFGPNNLASLAYDRVSSQR